MYTGTYYLRHFWAIRIPERIIYATFGPHVYRNVLFATFLTNSIPERIIYDLFGQLYTGTYYLRPFYLFDKLYTRTYYLGRCQATCVRLIYILSDYNLLQPELFTTLLNQVGPRVYRNALFTTLFDQPYIGTHHCRPFLLSLYWNVV